MGDKSGIEWTDATWNPVTGCTKVSPGCDHCYAERVTERFHGPGSFEQVTLHPDRLDLPSRWRKPRRVFVNSMSDLFHDDVPTPFIVDVFSAMASNPRHTFQVLTKRHGRMRSLMNDQFFRGGVRARMPADVKPPPGELAWPLPNVWLGVSVENQKWADIRIPALLDTPATVRFLSCEPLLGPIDLFGDFERPGPACTAEAYTIRTDYGTGIEYDIALAPGVDWVIVGGESGPGARPMHPDWARSLRDECEAAGVPFLFKQAGTVLAREWGAKGKGTDPAEWPELFPREYPEVVTAQ